MFDRFISVVYFVLLLCYSWHLALKVEFLWWMWCRVIFILNPPDNVESTLRLEFSLGYNNI